MQRPKRRPAGIVALATSVVPIALATLLTAHPAAAAPMTFNVTSTSCEGAGSITEAMNSANTNPGVDTIEFDAGLVVDARNCPPDPATELDNAKLYTLQATESVVIEGNGARLEAVQSWISDAGENVANRRCPEGSDFVTALAVGLITVGTKDQDNSNITVTVRDLDLDGLSQVARIERNATLIMEDLTVTRIYAGITSAGCTTAAVDAREGANFAAHRTTWGDMRNDATTPLGILYVGVIGGNNAGDLTIEDSYFADIRSSGVIAWTGQAGSEVNIVSSRFDDTGGINIDGDASGKIVNSIWASQPFDDPQIDEKIVNFSFQPLEIIASTLLFASDGCDLRCQQESVNLNQPRGWVHRALGSADIDFAQSAVAVNFPNAPVAEHAPLLNPNEFDPVPGFSADLYTWVMQTELQNTAALKTVTNQPSLLTDPPDSLPTQLAYLEQRATPLNGGELIGAVDDAVCDDNTPANDEANALRNPIDDSCITTDALGNPRVDGSGNRDIGAVQLGLAPHLTVVDKENQKVGLSWTKPLDPGGTITGYQVEYRQTGGPTWTPICVDGADTLEYAVMGLTNGTEYEFRVDSWIGGTCPTGSTSGNPSNIVVATPFATVQAPTVTATPSVCQVHLSWNEPDAGPETIDHYTVSYRFAGNPNSNLANGFVTDLEYNVTGLLAGQNYEFAVRAVTTTGTNGSQGTVQAMTTKRGDIDVSGTVTYNDDRPLFLAANGSAIGDSNYNPNADLDCDGRVTPADYRLWYKAWIADGRQR